MAVLAKNTRFSFARYLFSCWPLLGIDDGDDDDDDAFLSIVLSRLRSRNEGKSVKVFFSINVLYRMNPGCVCVRVSV